MPNADAEHTAEWTGNTLGMMVQIDYGNPLWIERSMKTAKLMRDLWTDINDKGQRHFRANFFGAAKVGTGDQMNDSWINYRAIRPASAVLWYNNNPAIRDLYLEIADAWVENAMSKERGKPKGVIPAQVSFPEGLLGGTNSPNWWTASHKPGTVNYDWKSKHDAQHYKNYIQDLLITAYELTRDKKYIKPLKLEYKLAKKAGNVAGGSKGSRLQNVFLKGAGYFKGADEVFKKAPAKAAKPGAQQEDDEPEPAEPGSEEWVGQNLVGTGAWLMAERIMKGRKGELENDVLLEDIIDYSKRVLFITESKWPLMTTEASATDRVLFHGVCDPFFIYTGGQFGGPFLRAAVTYENTTRKFAAAVLGADPQGLRILYYSLTDSEREISLVPWELEAGGTYSLTYGPDDDADGKMDSVESASEFVLTQRGKPIPVKIKPKQTYLIEIDQIKRGKGADLAPDPGLSHVDIRYHEEASQILVRIHNVGSLSIRDVEVAAYLGDPAKGGELIGVERIPNIEAPIDLEPRAVTVGFRYDLSQKPRDIYIVIDPEDKIQDEITTFNNTAHKILPEAPVKDAPKKKSAGATLKSGRR